MLGSSPLTRGKQIAALTEARDARLIPAHAGKTVLMSRMTTPPSAHPRSRGENNDPMLHYKGHVGSSPLTRGKPASVSQCERQPRLIPAHAGKTMRHARRATPSAAHPRSRGENHGHRSTPPWRSGSSPLTRGKLFYHSAFLFCPGLIPAHAGKTLPDLRFYCADRSDLGNP